MASIDCHNYTIIAQAQNKLDFHWKPLTDFDTNKLK